MKALLQKLKDHFQKLMGALGAVLLTLDLTVLKGYADRFLTPRIAQWVGVALFVLITLRAAYVSWGQPK